MLMESYSANEANSGLLNNTNSIENTLSLFNQYNPLERQIEQLQALEGPEDPPETLHTSWGIWLHRRDPLHGIDQRYDTKHVIRTGMVAEDILHYYHYVPVNGDHEPIHEAYKMNFEYDYSNESDLYNSEINLAKEMEEFESNYAINAVDTENEDNLLDAEIGSDEAGTINEADEEPDARDNNIPENDLSLELEAQLTKIFEKFLMNINIGA